MEEKEIVRPQDMIVKSVGNKSGNTIFIIQAIDRKMDFEDIARTKDLDFDKTFNEIEVDRQFQEQKLDVSITSNR